MIVKTTGAGVERGRRRGGGRARRTAAATTRPSAARRSTTPRSSRRSQGRRNRQAPKQAQRDARQVKVESLDDLVEFFIAAGKKGIAVNRYKGLGEMNPDTLWETTMDPSKRTLLQVKAEDHTDRRPDVHHADGRPGRAAAQVHRRQRARRQEPGHLNGVSAEGARGSAKGANGAKGASAKVLKVLKVPIAGSWRTSTGTLSTSSTAPLAPQHPEHQHR